MGWTSGAIAWVLFSLSKRHPLTGAAPVAVKCDDAQKDTAPCPAGAKCSPQPSCCPVSAASAHVLSVSRPVSCGAGLGFSCLSLTALVSEL